MLGHRDWRQYFSSTRPRYHIGELISPRRHNKEELTYLNGTLQTKPLLHFHLPTQANQFRSGSIPARTLLFFRGVLTHADRRKHASFPAVRSVDPE